jgi:hypothetical protein
MDEYPSPFGTPGEPVPIVDAADLKAAWNFFRQIESEHPGGGIAVGMELIKRTCNAGAAIGAVTYRCQMLGLLEMCRGNAVMTWKRNGRFDEAVFRVAANIPMKWPAYNS